MTSPLKPLIDHGVDPAKITTLALADPGSGLTVGWEVRAVFQTEDGVVIQMHGVRQSLSGAAAQCIEQLNTARGITIEIVNA